MNLSNVVIGKGDRVRIDAAVKALPPDSVSSPRPITASAYDGGYFVSTTYSSEAERDEIKFKLPGDASLVVNEPWYSHAWWRPKDIRRATVAVFTHLGIKYTFARELVG